MPSTDLAKVSGDLRLPPLGNSEGISEVWKGPPEFSDCRTLGASAMCSGGHIAEAVLVPV